MIELARRGLEFIQQDDDDGHYAKDIMFFASTPLAVWIGFNSCMSFLMFILIFYMKYHE